MSGYCIGFPFLKGSEAYPTTHTKKFAYRLFRWMIRVITGERISDPTTGLQGLNRKTVLYYSKYKHFDDKYPDANMIVQMLLLKFKIEEVPAVMHPRNNGVSMHHGLKPIMYMFRMVFSILAVTFRIKVLKVDAGAGMQDVFEKSEHKYKLRPALIRENAQPYYSPGRGWYHIYTFCPGEKNVEQLKWLPLEEQESLVLLRLDIGQFREKEIDRDTLLFTGMILKRFQNAKKTLYFVFVMTQMEMDCLLSHPR